jgi:hypothetical protein
MAGSKPNLGYEKVGGELFLTLDGVRIAKRGDPDSLHARTWISIEPGYEVFDNADLTELVVHFNKGVRLQ